VGRARACQGSEFNVLTNDALSAVVSTKSGALAVAPSVGTLTNASEPPGSIGAPEGRSRDRDLAGPPWIATAGA